MNQNSQLVEEDSPPKENSSNKISICKRLQSQLISFGKIDILLMPKDIRDWLKLFVLC